MGQPLELLIEGQEGGEVPKPPAQTHALGAVPPAHPDLHGAGKPFVELVQERGEPRADLARLRVLDVFRR
ncbi:MAG: hypothetical protein IT285_15080 [Bdellovibrionales bacterium]|nr:hypothetical protein [Bdellovibrionales bacterium]